MLSHQQSDLSVLVVDDHELTRLSLKLALAKQKNIKLISLASNGKEAIEIVENHQPDVVILDLQMPVMDGLSAAVKIKTINPNIKIIAYSSVEDPRVNMTISTSPLDAFCSKDVSTDYLLRLVNHLSQKSNSTQELIQSLA